MEKYCRFCAEKHDHLSNLENGVCDWVVEILNRKMENVFENDYLENIPHKICYSCLCKIEDINWFLESCSKSLLRLRRIYEKEFTIRQKLDSISETNTSTNEEIQESFELEYLETSDEDIVLKNLNNEEISNDNESFHENKKFEDISQLTNNSKTTNNLSINNNNTIKSYLCTKCGANFTDRQNFNYHMKKHMNENVFVCDFCKKSFITKYQLSSHRWIHTGAGFENHECEQCGKKCRTSYELEIHMRFHKQLRQYQCEICSKSFILKVHLKQHMVTHTGERNFICNAPGCNKSYTTVSSLKKHKDIHLSDSEKNISCEHCNKKFSMQFILKDHIRKSHRKLLTESVKELKT
ncbi:zinc finger protein 431-like [Condylostylus longicornis]|uniref:zinc finger protein 431-like n=1 Tax=Condylostylus longicornis TaxID=2530218 RepID=UPI00244DF324|nr:zinc finger protein 431-like [Condylostylus longicornis]